MIEVGFTRFAEGKQVFRRWERANWFQVTDDWGLELYHKDEKGHVLIAAIPPGQWEVIVDVDLSEGKWPQAPRPVKIGVDDEGS